MREEHPIPFGNVLGLAKALLTPQGSRHASPYRTPSRSPNRTPPHSRPSTPMREKKMTHVRVRISPKKQVDEEAVAIWRKRPCPSVWKSRRCNDEDCKLMHFNDSDGSKINVCFNYVNRYCHGKCDKVHLEGMNGYFKGRLCFFQYTSDEGCKKYKRACKLTTEGKFCKYWQQGICRHERKMVKTCKYIHP